MTWTWPLQPAPGADADGRDAQPLGDRRGELLGHELEDDREGAGLLDGSASARSARAWSRRLALDPDLADRVDRLRRQADVAHDRDAGPDERLDRSGRVRTPPSTLTAWAPASRRKRAGVLERLLGRRVGQERHVADDQRALRAADDGLGVVEHLGHRDAHGRLVAEHDLAERVADEEHRDARPRRGSARSGSRRR